MQTSHFRIAHAVFAIALLATMASTARGAPRPLNDSGQTRCFQGENADATAVDCDDASWPGQDAGIGRDAAPPTKIGAGAAGFDFTKLSNEGAELSSRAEPGEEPEGWGCTRDNLTGLTWRVATTANIGWIGAHAVAVDAQYCGFSDWRIPELGELQGLVHYGHHAPAIDAEYFPGTASDFHWVDTPDPTAPGRRAWAVNFSGGFVNAIRQDAPAHLRLVRGKRASGSADGKRGALHAVAEVRGERWLHNANGTITDLQTGLIWDRCSIGQVNAECDGEATQMTWQRALELVRQRNANNWRGRNDWRLANVKELSDLLGPAPRDAGMERMRERPPGSEGNPFARQAMLDTMVFRHAPDQAHWTSTTYEKAPRMAWAVFFGNGSVFGKSKNSRAAVRLVRGGNETTTASAITQTAAASPTLPRPATARDPATTAIAEPVPLPETLPLLSITTDGGAPIIGREKHHYVDADLKIESSDPELAFEGRMIIKGRGNSTWQAPKKPYRIKLDEKAALLGMPSSRHWALLANHYYKSLLRNQLALEWGDALGMAWTSRIRTVEVELNGDYLGVYQLAETIRIAKTRVDIAELKPSDVTEPKITGGYLFEIDRRRECALASTYIQFDTARGVPICIESPDEDDIVPEQSQYLREHVQQAEDVLYGPDFADPQHGYAAWFDTASFIDWYLVNELTANPDARNFSSIWNYKDRGGRIMRGPLWDFDLGAGNASHCRTCADPFGFWVRDGYWYNRLFEDLAFATAVRTRWDEVKDRLAGNLAARIDAAADALGAAVARNFERWPVLDVDAHEEYNVVVTGSHEGDVTWLKDWFAQRAAWLDANL